MILSSSSSSRTPTLHLLFEKQLRQCNSGVKHHIREFKSKFYWQNNKSFPQVTSLLLHAQKVFFFLSPNSMLMLTHCSLLSVSPIHPILAFALLLSPLFSLSSGLLFYFTAWSLFRFPRLELPQRSPLPTSVSGLEARDTMEKHQKIKRAERRFTTGVR